MPTQKKTKARNQGAVAQDPGPDCCQTPVDMKLSDYCKKKVYTQADLDSKIEEARKPKTIYDEFIIAQDDLSYAEARYRDAKEQLAHQERYLNAVRQRVKELAEKLKFEAIAQL